MLFPNSYVVQPFTEECKLWLEKNINGNGLGITQRGGVIVKHEFIERELLDLMEQVGLEEGEDFEIVPR